MIQYIKTNLVISTTLLIIIIVGLIKSSTVLGGDQSLFVVIAQMLDSGKTLYKDLFDYKQPGIYLFYLMAGKTLGWNDIDIHLFELGYWILFSLVLFSTIRKYSLFHADYFNGLLPLFIVVVYYCSANPMSLTQLEALINFPLFIVIWLLDRAYKTEDKWFITYLAIGIFIGIILLCKLVFGPIIAFFLLIHFIFILRDKNLKYIIRTLLPLIIGFILPVSAFLSYIFIHQIEDLVFNIYFKIPTSVIGLNDQIDPDRLLSSIKWFIKRTLVFLPLAIIGIFFIPKKESHFFSLVIAWGIIGTLVILMQKTSWWPYHFQLLYVPIGIFAALGLDFLMHHLLLKMQLKTQMIKCVLIVTILSLVFFNPLNILWRGFASINYSHGYDYAKNDSANIAKIIKPDDTIFICGNPRMYLFTSHLPELSTNGWILEYYLDYQWEEFYSEFKNKPPSYLFIENRYEKLIESKSKKIRELVDREYSKYDTVENGKWYKRNTI